MPSHGEPASPGPGAAAPASSVPPILPDSDMEEVVGAGQSLPEGRLAWLRRLKVLLIGRPRDLGDKSVFHRVSLVAFLAWVGLGADGLSSSCYGPPEAFINLGEHRYLAVFLGMAIAVTVFVIASCYSHIIEEFPSGGGGYLVASKLLGNRVGVISGCALLVDYVLTITVSIAAAGDALFGLLGPDWMPWKLTAEFAAILALIVLNLRGVKESVQALMPIFLLFLLTHLIVIVGSVLLHITAVGTVTADIVQHVETGLRDPKLGLWGMLTILLYAYSLGAGTYTGLEAVSNSMPVMREPRVATARRTMQYMAFSLALTAGGLIVAYLLLGIVPAADKTMNLLLTQDFIEQVGMGGSGLGTVFLLATLVSEGALLFVGAQAGFIGGAAALGYMAQDSWMPRWFANLSERLATHNGILLMGLSALAALWYTSGNVATLVIMYSINVFVTFSLSMIGMTKHWFSLRGQNPLWRRRLALFISGSILCVGILVVTVMEKFYEGGWRTLAVTGVLVCVAFFIHRYYRKVGERLKRLDDTLGRLVTGDEPNQDEPDPTKPAAVVLVGGYSGLGVHTMLNTIRFIPGHFASFVFVSVGVVDSGNFKGSSEVESLREHTHESLKKYVELSRRLGMPATSYASIGTDAVEELEKACLMVAQDFPKATFFAGQLVFQKETWVDRLLHNQTAYSLQRRLQWAGFPMVILPCRVR